METFTYTIQDEAGIHARPAGMLIKRMQAFQSEITLTCGERTIDCKKLFALMGLGVRQGETITIAATGPDEKDTVAAAVEVLQNNL